MGRGLCGCASSPDPTPSAPWALDLRCPFQMDWTPALVKSQIRRCNDLVVSALGIPARGPRFDSRFVPLFHWVATLVKLFTHVASPVSQLQETGVQKGVFGA